MYVFGFFPYPANVEYLPLTFGDLTLIFGYLDYTVGYNLSVTGSLLETSSN